jgi:hypothetical protein
LGVRPQNLELELVRRDSRRAASGMGVFRFFVVSLDAYGVGVGVGAIAIARCAALVWCVVCVIGTWHLARWQSRWRIAYLVP